MTKISKDEWFKGEAKKAIETCKKYGFMQQKIHPYAFSITVEEFVSNWEDYDNFTPSSKAIMRDELKGFLPILSHWVDIEESGDVEIRYLVGNREGEVDTIKKLIADDFVEVGLAEFV